MCTSRLERQLRARGYRRIAGLDEAGRGSLFGPVYAAAVVLNGSQVIRGLNDSKQLTAGERERLAGLIRSRAAAWAVAWVEAAEIDRVNILEASRKAMKLACGRLEPPPDFLLVDAVRLDTAIPQRAVIHGDALVRSIAAASILAKVERDAAMRDWDKRYPGYGLAIHKGYATAAHLDALARNGPTPEHRRSFAPVRGLIEPCRQQRLFEEC